MCHLVPHLECILHFSTPCPKENQFAFTLDIYIEPGPRASVAHWLLALPCVRSVVTVLLPADIESKQAVQRPVKRIGSYWGFCVGM